MSSTALFERAAIFLLKTSVNAASLVCRTTVGRYNVPYQALVPKRGTGANLLVPVCLSASAVAYSSTRIESMFMYVGTAAGETATSLLLLLLLPPPPPPPPPPPFSLLLPPIV
jgi:hypothetical protein